MLQQIEPTEGEAGDFSSGRPREGGEKLPRKSLADTNAESRRARLQPSSLAVAAQVLQVKRSGKLRIGHYNQHSEAAWCRT